MQRITHALTLDSHIKKMVDPNDYALYTTTSAHSATRSNLIDIPIWSLFDGSSIECNHLRNLNTRAMYHLKYFLGRSKTPELKALTGFAELSDLRWYLLVLLAKGQDLPNFERQKNAFAKLFKGVEYKTGERLNIIEFVQRTLDTHLNFKSPHEMPFKRLLSSLTVTSSPFENEDLMRELEENADKFSILFVSYLNITWHNTYEFIKDHPLVSNTRIANMPPNHKKVYELCAVDDTGAISMPDFRTARVLIKKTADLTEDATQEEINETYREQLKKSDKWKFICHDPQVRDDIKYIRALAPSFIKCSAKNQVYSTDDNNGAIKVKISVKPSSSTVISRLFEMIGKVDKNAYLTAHWADNLKQDFERTVDTVSSKLLKESLHLYDQKSYQDARSVDSERTKVDGWIRMSRPCEHFEDFRDKTKVAICEAYANRVLTISFHTDDLGVLNKMKLFGVTTEEFQYHIKNRREVKEYFKERFSK